jgi:hypothetical protein
MSPEKERTIFERWPHWFRDAGDLRLSLMSWGFTCGDGWYDIIYQLCERLEPLVAALDDGGAAFQVVQVKEKFGGLRFYVDDANDEIHSAIEAACELSVKTCEVCGNPGSCEQDETGWWKTLCISCRKLGQAKRW